MTDRPPLQVIRGGDYEQASRRLAFEKAHPEVQWGRAGNVHVAYVPMPHGGYTTGAESLREVLDSLEEFFREDPDSG